MHNLHVHEVALRIGEGDVFTRNRDDVDANPRRLMLVVELHVHLAHLSVHESLQGTG